MAFSELEVVMMRKVTVAAAAVLLAAACADTDTSPGAGADVPEPSAAQAAPGDTLDQTTLPPDDGDLRTVDATLTEWAITLSQDSVASGAIAFNVRNTGTRVHRFEVEGNGEEWESEDISPGDEVTMSLNLSPGLYQVYCPIVEDGESHEELGMRTTLSVH